MTGQAYNSASDLPGQPEEFHVAGPANNYRSTPAKPIQGAFSGSAKFVFVTEDGCVNTWSANTEEDGLFGRLNARKGQIPKS